MTPRKLNLALMFVVSVGIAGPVAAQQEYPSKAINLIVPYGPGGGPDVLARRVAQGISKIVKQQVVVINKPGATGLVGTQTLARSAADGYTIGYISMATLVAQVMSAKPIVNLPKDVAIIAAPFQQYTVLLVQPSEKIRNVRDLIAQLKSMPNGGNFSSGGNGTPAHLAGELFRRAFDLKATHVPYKQLTAALVDVMGGEVQYIFSIGGSAVPLVKSGKLRALAVAAPKRLSVLPEVPTLEEAVGVDLDVSTWNALIAPAATPVPILRKLHQLVYQVVDDPANRKAFEALGLEIVEIPFERSSELLRTEAPRWEKFVKEANITAN